MHPPFTSRADHLLRWAVFGLALLTLSLVAAVAVAVRSDPRTGVSYAPEQPVPFSHEHHAGKLGLDCRYCHDRVETDAFAGMPATSVCMTCHSQLFTDAEMLEPLRESLASGVPIEWKRVYNAPDYVYFDHGVHVSNGVGCAECHGAVAAMPLTREVGQMTMSWCLNCHRDPGPNLRDKGFLYDTLAEPPRDPERLMKRYHVKTEGLTDCTACHR